MSNKRRSLIPYNKYIHPSSYSLRVRYKLCTMKRGLIAFAKSIGLCQPAQSAQADINRYFSLSLNFLNIKGLFYDTPPPPKMSRLFDKYIFPISLRLIWEIFAGKVKVRQNNECRKANISLINHKLIK